MVNKKLQRKVYSFIAHIMDITKAVNTAKKLLEVSFLAYLGLSTEGMRNRQLSNAKILQGLANSGKFFHNSGKYWFGTGKVLRMPHCLKLTTIIGQ